MRRAYASAKPATAKRQILNLAKNLKSLHPSAAESIGEGLDETLTVMALQLPTALDRTLSPTKPIENVNEPDSLRFEPREAFARRRDGSSLDARGRARG